MTAENMSGTVRELGRFVASMRPRPMTAENERRRRRVSEDQSRFNEAAADDRGKRDDR